MYWYGDCYAAPFNLYDKIGMEVKHLDKGYDIAITWELNDVVGTYSYAGIIEHAYPDYVDWGYYMYNPGDAFPLATPEVSASANGNAITLSWGAVENAASYTIFKSVEVDYEREYVELATVNSDVLTYTITDLEFNTDYTFGVQANAAQGDTNYKNSNIAGVTQKTTFDYNKPDYTIELTKVVSIEGNIITLAGDNENDTVTIVFNPGLSSIVAGEYTGVTAWEFDSSYHSVPVWSSTSALEFSCVNGTNFNIAEAYLSSGYYESQGNAVISIDANNNYNIVLNVVCSEILVKYTYNGKLGGTEEPEYDYTNVTLTSAVATHADSSYIGGTGYDITFTDGTTTIVCQVQTKDKTYLKARMWDQSVQWGEVGYINSLTWTGVSNPWPYEMNVKVVDGKYNIAIKTFDFDVNSKPEYNATFVGQIEGFTLPEEEESVVVPEFVIPGEGGSYTYDYSYTKLVDGLDDNNSIRVAQDNGWIWDIKFNKGLASIEPGDYKATNDSFTTKDALEVDTYNGGFQFEYSKYIYPDEYDKVTTFNVQKQGDIYCITMIGSGGYNCPSGASYRCVYIGKIENN